MNPLNEARKARDEAFAAYRKAEDTFKQIENSLLKQYSFYYKRDEGYGEKLDGQMFALSKNDLIERVNKGWGGVKLIVSSIKLIEN